MNRCKLYLECYSNVYIIVVYVLTKKLSFYFVIFGFTCLSSFGKRSQVQGDVRGSVSVPVLSLLECWYLNINQKTLAATFAMLLLQQFL